MHTSFCVGTEHYFYPELHTFIMLLIAWTQLGVPQSDSSNDRLGNLPTSKGELSLLSGLGLSDPPIFLHLVENRLEVRPQPLGY